MEPFVDVRPEAKRLACQLGISVFPLGRNSKRPTCSWLDYQRQIVTEQQVNQWHASSNLAIVTGGISGLVVLDFESRDDAIWFWRWKGKTKAITKTRRGYHFYFQHPGGTVANGVKIKDEQGNSRYDVRGDGGYVVAPPSSVDGKFYSWVDGFILLSKRDLPVVHREWLPMSQPMSNSKVQFGAAYIRKIFAVSGQDGHSNTWRAVNKLKLAGLCESEALATMVEWNNTNASPPWSVRELLHKVRSAYR